MSNWIEAVRKYELYNDRYSISRKYCITRDEEKISTELLMACGMKIPPLMHQAATIQVMLDIELQQKCKVKIVNRDVANANYNMGSIETRAAVLSEKPGSGKTYEILSLIAINPIPMSPDSKNSEFIQIAFRHPGHQRMYWTGYKYALTITRTYSKQLRQTLIFVGKSVLSQWIESITMMTSFKVLVIDNVHSLKKFYTMCFKSEDPVAELDEYDIILVKNGGISGKFDIEELTGTRLEYIKNKSILSIFGELFSTIQFARVVLDDFDYLAIPNSAKSIASCFTWFISATKKRIDASFDNVSHISNRELIRSYHPKYCGMWSNDELFVYFNVSCEDTFIDDSIGATPIDYYIYKFKNPNETYIELINAIGTNEANSIMEMINGDAIKTAAETAGISSTSVADIFEKILNKKWKRYQHNITVSTYIIKIKQYIVELLPKIFSLSKSQITAIEQNIDAAGPYAQFVKLVTHKCKEIDDIVELAEKVNNEEKAENGKSIERVKDNIRQGECPITCTPLAEAKSVLIAKCCGLVVSGEAIQIAFNMRREFASTNTGEGNVIISGSCPNCRAHCKLNDLIHIDKEYFDAESIISDKIQELPIAPPVEKEKIPDKYDRIIDIINGKHSAIPRERYDMNLDGVLTGPYDKGYAPRNERKIIIYANFSETITHIEEILHKNDIAYCKLQGTQKQICNIVSDYTNSGVNVLLISGPKYCAGLNLQMTTDLIFAHKVLDHDIEVQIAGRAARYGRKYNLQIHYMLYENEHRIITRRNHA